MVASGLDASLSHTHTSTAYPSAMTERLEPDEKAEGIAEMFAQVFGRIPAMALNCASAVRAGRDIVAVNNLRETGMCGIVLENNKLANGKKKFMAHDVAVFSLPLTGSDSCVLIGFDVWLLSMCVVDCILFAIVRSPDGSKRGKYRYATLYRTKVTPQEDTESELYTIPVASKGGRVKPVKLAATREVKMHCTRLSHIAQATAWPKPTTKEAWDAIMDAAKFQCKVQYDKCYTVDALTVMAQCMEGKKLSQAISLKDHVHSSQESAYREGGKAFVEYYTRLPDGKADDDDDDDEEDVVEEEKPPPQVRARQAQAQTQAPKRARESDGVPRGSQAQAPKRQRESDGVPRGSQAQAPKRARESDDLPLAVLANAAATAQAAEEPDAAAAATSGPAQQPEPRGGRQGKASGKRATQQLAVALVMTRHDGVLHSAEMDEERLQLFRIACA